MEILEFGAGEDKPVILFIQGSMTHWSWYKNTIDLLADSFHLIVPVLKGHGSDEKKMDTESFISVEDTVAEIKAYLFAHGYTELFGAYGLSIGGAIVTQMLATKTIPIKKALIDGGITPYPYSKIIIYAILLRDFLAIKLIQKSRSVLKRFLKFEGYGLSQEEIEEFYNETIRFLQTISNTTIKNIFYSANNYTMPKTISTSTAVIEYWYGEHEKKERKDNMAYIKSIFPHTIFTEIKGMEHGEFITMKPSESAQKIKEFFNFKGN